MRTRSRREDANFQLVKNGFRKNRNGNDSERVKTDLSLDITIQSWSKTDVTRGGSILTMPSKYGLDIGNASQKK